MSAPEMERLGLLTVVDGPAFAALCQTYARWREAELKLSGDVDGGPTAQERFHLTAEIGRYLAQIRAFCSEFGLTPASRGRIQLPSAAPDDDLGGLLR
jgi:P27 family predicted phage terminase small subunit